MLFNTGSPFIPIVGARGTGKTYGVLKFLIEKKLKFMYMRRLATQVDLITESDYNPFKDLNSDMGWSIEALPIKKNQYGFYNVEIDDSGKMIPQGELLGRAVALSVISNLRGFSGRDIDVIFYEEFIKEPQERKIPSEGMAFMQAYETMNRNREFQGKPPIIVIFAANSFELANPIFIEFGWVELAERMLSRGQELMVSPERRLTMVIPQESPISKAKEQTALYQAARGNAKLKEINLQNNFADYQTKDVKSCKLIEYKPLVKIGEITIYMHKSITRSKGAYYVSFHTMTNNNAYGTTDIEIKRFQRKYMHIWRAYMRELIYFESFMAQQLFISFFD